MKKALVIFLTLTMLIASFAFVGGASADENAPHICLYTGFIVPPGLLVTIEIFDIDGVLQYSETLDATNATDFVFSENYLSYLPVVSGTAVLTLSFPPYGTFSATLPANELGNGECFDDFRLNSRPDRDLAAPVAVYIRFAEDGDGFDGYDVYDINQVAGTGTLSIRVTDDELNDAADEAVASGANVTVAQEGDVIFTVLSTSTDETAVCQVNATDSEGKPYEYQWTCLG